jgi:hypothetical protein
MVKMPVAIANSIEISYETFGRPDNPCLVLVMGLGEQMITWPELVEHLSHFPDLHPI